MNFLFPAALGWLALALPIIALYLIRTRLERRSVSTLLFWDQIPTQTYNSALWRKLRRWLSLLLQLLFLLLVVLALAQPLAPWQSAQPARTVFILDPSASMSAQNDGAARWERALEMLNQRIRQMRPFDRAAILVAGDPPKVLSGWTASRRMLLDALKKARPEAGPVSLQSALALAENLRTTQPNASLLVLTDGVWSETFEMPADVGMVTLGEPQPNSGITHFSARRSLSDPGQVRLSVEAVTSGTEAANGVIEVSRDGQLVDVQKVSLEPGAPWQREWNVRTDEASVFEARLVDFPGDALGVDDSAQASVAALVPVRVALVSGPNTYLEAALAALPLVEWARVEPGSEGAFPDPEALYVFNRVNPPKGFDSANANCLLINPPSEGFWGRPDGVVERPLVSGVAEDEALVRHTGFASVSLQDVTKWDVPKHAEVFADSFGDPLIYGQWDERRKWAVLAFDLAGSDLVLRTAFPILLGNAVESLRAVPADGIVGSSAPGRIESALKRTAPPASGGEQGAPRPSRWWFAFPLWWWAIFTGCVWLLTEWWLTTRKVTE